MQSHRHILKSQNFCSFVSHRGTNVAEIRLTFKSSVETSQHATYERSNLTAVSKLVFRWPSLMILRTFCKFSSVRPLKGWPERASSSTEYHNTWTKTTLKSLFYPHGLVTESSFEQFIRCRCSFPESEAIPKETTFFSSNQLLESEFHLTQTIIITRWEAI